MEATFIAVRSSMTLADLARVVRQKWSLDESRSQPHVFLDKFSRAYVAELDPAETANDPLFRNLSRGVRHLVTEITEQFVRLAGCWRPGSSDDPHMPGMLRPHRGLATQSMLVNATGAFVTPTEFLSTLNPRAE
jgi:hypothetical protein